MRKFVIISQGRSGSTLLRRLLHSEPRICCHGEVFARKRVLGLVPHPDLPDPGRDFAAMRDQREAMGLAAFTTERVFAPRDGVLWTGFKALDMHFEEPALDAFLGGMIDADPDIHLVFLHREDQWARFLSAMVQRGIIDPAAPEQARVPRVRLERFMNRALEHRAALWGRFPANPCLYLSYEQLVADLPAACARLDRFFGIDEGRYRVDVAPGETLDYDSLVANHAALRRHYLDTWSAEVERVFARP